MKSRMLDLVELAVLCAVVITVIALLAFGGPGCATMSTQDQERAACIGLCLARAGMDAATCREVTGTQAIDLQACILQCTCKSKEGQ